VIGAVRQKARPDTAPLTPAITQAEKLAQAKVSISRNRPLAGDDRANAALGHADFLGQAVLADTHWLQKFFQHGKGHILQHGKWQGSHLVL
jgi:hypothetical protein